MAAQFKLTMCAGQGFHIRPIVREYRESDRVWLLQPGVSVFGDKASMFPYMKYVPESVDGGEA
jgi:hypothetical protein